MFPSKHPALTSISGEYHSNAEMQSDATVASAVDLFAVRLSVLLWSSASPLCRSRTQKADTLPDLSYIGEMYMVMALASSKRVALAVMVPDTPGAESSAG